MIQIYRVFSGLFPLLALGFAVLAALGLAAWARLVRQRLSRSATGTRVLVDIILLGNLLGYVVLTVTPGYGRAFDVNLVPFYEVYQVLTTRDVPTAPVFEVLGNLVLLVPMGALVGVRWPRMDTVGRVFGVGLGVGLAAEVFQFVSASGRVASVTDVLLGGLGAAIGCVLFRLSRSFVAGRLRLGVALRRG